MPKCSYCNKEYELYKGITIVQKDGNIKYLCSSKCRKSMKNKKRKARWIHKKEKKD